MADPNFLDLARLAVTLPGWRWMPGMLATFRGNWTQSTQMEARVEIQRSSDGTAGDPGYADLGSSDPGFEPLPPDALPDLSDPATKGCLLALARDHQRRPNLCVVAMSHCRSVESDAVLAWFVVNEPMSGDGDPPEFLGPDGRWGSDSRCAAWQTEVDALVAALGESDE